MTVGGLQVIQRRFQPVNEANQFRLLLRVNPPLFVQSAGSEVLVENFLVIGRRGSGIEFRQIVGLQ